MSVDWRDGESWGASTMSEGDRRKSYILNDDNFDYALELRPDDEYRQAAHALDRVADIGDEDSASDSDGSCSSDDDLFSPERHTSSSTGGRTSTTSHAAALSTMAVGGGGEGGRGMSISGAYFAMSTGYDAIRTSLGFGLKNTAATSSGNSSSSGSSSNSTSSGGGSSSDSSNTATGGSKNKNKSAVDSSHSTGGALAVEQRDPSGLDRAACDVETGPISPVKAKSTPKTPTSSGMGKSPGQGVDGGLYSPLRSPMAGTGHGAASLVPAAALVTEKTFKASMMRLDKRQKWAKKASRRSTVAFLQAHWPDDKTIADRLLLALARGVFVRRHQANKFSEPVRLFSKNGCSTFAWEPENRAEDVDPKSGDVRPGAGGSSSSSSASARRKSTATTASSSSSLSGDSDKPTASASRSGSDKTSMSGRDALAASWLGLCHNLGFRRHGCISDDTVIAVHPATSQDPTLRGYSGTEGFRQSSDVFNAGLSLSIISAPLKPGVLWEGVSSLDIECGDEDTYYLLLCGFKLVQQEAEAARNRARMLAVAEGEEDAAAAGSVRERFERAVSSWTSAMAVSHLGDADRPDGTEGGGAGAKNDPISTLFDKPSTLGLQRGLTGLLGIGSAVDNPLKNSHSELPPAQFLGWKSAGTQIWARLKMAGLDVRCSFAFDLRRVILKIRCPEWRLEDVAERMHMKLRRRDGQLKRFKISRRDDYEARGPFGSLFRSSERQQIIDFIIRTKIKDGGAELDENTELGIHIKQRFPLHMYKSLEELRHTWVAYWRVDPLGEAGKPWSPVSTPFKETCRRIAASMEHFFGGLLTQPLDDIAAYYGEGVAFYFAYLSFYTRWLIWPAVLGLVVFAMQLADAQWDHWACIPYGVFVMLWACFMLAFWRQEQSQLAYRWGVLDFEMEETERPQFAGTYQYDDFTGEVVKVYPAWKRVLKYSVTIPVLSTFIFAMLCLMLLLFSSQDELLAEYERGEDLDYSPTPASVLTLRRLAGILVGSRESEEKGGQLEVDMDMNMDMDMDMDPPRLLTADNSTVVTEGTFSFTSENLASADYWYAVLFYPCIYSITAVISIAVFDCFAAWFNDFENHRTQTSYANRLVLKVFSFRFVTVMTALYYYAFFADSSQEPYLRVGVTIFALMTVSHWWDKIVDVCIPTLLQQFKLYHLKLNVVSARRKVFKAQVYGATLGVEPGEAAMGDVQKRQKLVSQAEGKCWEEALLMPHTSIGDYSLLMLQLGLVLFFAMVFPLAPALALVNNLALIRMDAHKLCHTRQRPIAVKSSGIGIWENLLEVMSVLGILTNCMLMGLTSTQLKSRLADIGSAGLAVSLFCFEHVILLFKYWLNASIPKVPASVRRAQDRDRRSLAVRRKRKSVAVRMSMAANGGRPGGGTAQLPLRGDTDNDDDDDDDNDWRPDWGSGAGTVSVADDMTAGAHGAEMDTHNGANEAGLNSDGDHEYESGAGWATYGEDDEEEVYLEEGQYEDGNQHYERDDRGQEHEHEQGQHESNFYEGEVDEPPLALRPKKRGVSFAGDMLGKPMRPSLYNTEPTPICSSVGTSQHCSGSGSGAARPVSSASQNDDEGVSLGKCPATSPPEYTQYLQMGDVHGDYDDHDGQEEDENFQEDERGGFADIVKESQWQKGGYGVEMEMEMEANAGMDDMDEGEGAQVTVPDEEGDEDVYDYGQFSSDGSGGEYYDEFGRSSEDRAELAAEIEAERLAEEEAERAELAAELEDERLAEEEAARAAQSEAKAEALLEAELEAELAAEMAAEAEAEAEAGLLAEDDEGEGEDEEEKVEQYEEQEEEYPYSEYQDQYENQEEEEDDAEDPDVYCADEEAALFGSVGRMSFPSIGSLEAALNSAGHEEEDNARGIGHEHRHRERGDSHCSPERKVCAPESETVSESEGTYLHPEPSSNYGMHCAEGADHEEGDEFGSVGGSASMGNSMVTDDSTWSVDMGCSGGGGGGGGGGGLQLAALSASKAARVHVAAATPSHGSVGGAYDGMYFQAPLVPLHAGESAVTPPSQVSPMARMSILQAAAEGSPVGSRCSPLAVGGVDRGTNRGSAVKAGAKKQTSWESEFERRRLAILSSGTGTGTDSGSKARAPPVTAAAAAWGGGRDAGADRGECEMLTRQQAPSRAAPTRPHSATGAAPAPAPAPATTTPRSKTPATTTTTTAAAAAAAAAASSENVFAFAVKGRSQDQSTRVGRDASSSDTSREMRAAGLSALEQKLRSLEAVTGQEVRKPRISISSKAQSASDGASAPAQHQQRTRRPPTSQARQAAGVRAQLSRPSGPPGQPRQSRSQTQHPSRAAPATTTTGLRPVQQTLLPGGANPPPVLRSALKRSGAPAPVAGSRTASGAASGRWSAQGDGAGIPQQQQQQQNCAVARPQPRALRKVPLSPPPAKGILKKSTVVGAGAGSGASAAVSVAAPAMAKKTRRAENDGHAANMTRARMPSAAAGAAAGAGAGVSARPRPQNGVVGAHSTSRGLVKQMIARRESLPGHGKPLTPASAAAATAAAAAAARTASMARTPVAPRLQPANIKPAVKTEVANPFSFAEG